MLSFSFLAPLHFSLHGLLKEKIVDWQKSLLWKTFHRTSEVFQVTEPQISWMNYSRSDIKKRDYRPKFTSKLLQLALMLRYFSLPAYCANTLDLCEYIIRKSSWHERVAPENVMKSNDLPKSFLRDNHLENKFINRTICNVYFYNAQKLVNSQVRRAVVQQFNER